jgi:hydrogenase expression/formation protein HypC
MCLAIPTRIVQLLPDQMAKVSLDGVIKTVSVALLDDLKEGDYVILHVGYALARLDEEEALLTLDLLHQAGAVRA